MINAYGTTDDMVIQTVEENGKTLVLAIDSNGLYLTTQSRLNKQLADPNRAASNRKDVHARLVALGLDPEALTKENQHRIKVVSVAAAKKVNPLKASKRAMKK